MAEEKTQEVEPTDNDNGTTDANANGGTGKELSYEELQAELTRVRREAAGRRVQNKELDSELAEYRKWKESQMSDLEKANANLEELKKGRIEDARDLAQAKYGLEDDDMEFIHGTTKEEILASAKKYSERQGRNKDTDGEDEDRMPRNPNLFPGTRGEPVGSGRTDINARLREQLLGR